MTKPTVFAVSAGLLMFALAPQVRADDECSVADLRGDYSFILSGTIVSGAVPVVAAGKTTYHGDGNADGVIWVNLNGMQYFSNWDATYTLSPLAPCTFTKTLTLKGPGLPGAVFNFAITAGDDFRELRFVDTDMGKAITGTARKQ